MDHYLTEHEYQSIGNWEINPSRLQITTGTEDNIISLPKIGGVWRHTETGDVVVACDFGVGSYYEAYHIPNKYVEQGNGWLKSLRVQKDTANYSHGARVLQSERHNAKEFIQEVESYLQENSEGVLDEN